MTPAIWWVRRDLRLRHNEALKAAIDAGDTVVPLFALDPRLLSTGASKRIDFLYAGLRSLDDSLHEHGSRLFVRSGRPEDVVPALSRELGGAMVFAEEDYTPYARGRDQRVGKHAPLRLMPGLTVHHPTSVLKDNGQPYRVYSQFRRRWESIAPVASADDGVIEKLSSPPPLKSEPIPDSTYAEQVDEQAAHARLEKFTDADGAIWEYRNDRSRVDLDGTSGLSPFIRFGMIAATELAQTAQSLIANASNHTAKASAQSWLNELVWREFFQAAIFHFPESAKQSLRPDLAGIEWLNDKDDFEAWTEGRTGYPIVDAAMRQLSEEGWIHNRLRMVVASFLVKDLLIDWRWGERWFMRHLIDGDTAANVGGWQWTAGTGLDAAPYFRVFNPILQGKKFDPQGEYVRKWLPELRDIPNRVIQTPWEWSGLHRNSKSINGYPFPIIDHAFARARALDAFDAARHTASG